MSSSSPVSGLVVVDKPGGITSHGVVSRVRRLAGTRKVGHAGTLDPMATGVLVLGTNRATRLLGHLMLTRKAYDATIVLGVSTTTDDAEGEVTATRSAAHVDEAQVREALKAFVGDIEQVPTAVSAIKVDGKRAYARVRDGEEVVLKARPVTIDSIDVHRVETVGETVEVDVSVRCSSGTYIRAIARDLGAALDVGGHLGALRRTAVGGFDLARARTLEQLEESFEVVPLEDAARATFPTLDLDAEQAADVRFGRRLSVEVEAITAVFSPEGEFLALYEPAGAVAKPLAVFVQ
ncbi:tRNA pseudouridine(55) synthase TruB [Nocardioides jishulii]|uniref:tRNA pseudouridine synthase B n=1 Tax=Nocardioides jishulii TaxID=2575440 RepID=A0A4U2YK94_9ACTN|nr:tRNA pseudouridine(55) synthase TruB [Nocardioides jishulii]QCX27086.1 tRNA pseudouridine(55) synthase TruB [Nocardioides jishulii]TKI61569.1 tRNA pseudouridine(55) synthase TruB [Nocardioides jishulii]